MAITFSTLPTLQPAYSNSIILNAIDDGTPDSLYTYKFEVYIDTTLVDTFIYPADPVTFDATIDISPIITPHLESEVYVPTGITACEAIPDSMPYFRVRVTSYDEDNTQISLNFTDSLWFFNGCYNINEAFDMTDYLPNNSDPGTFLTNWNTDRAIMMDDHAYLTTITGDYGTGMISYFGGITVTTYENDTSVTAVTETYTGTSKALINIDVSPSTLNSIWADLITEDTQYYTVEATGGRSLEPLKICMNTENKIQRYFNFVYVNRLGGLDFFTAYKPAEDQYKISKKTLEQYVRRKNYYTESQETIKVLTQYLTSDDAEGLKELFTSPAVKVLADGSYNAVTINNGSVVIQDKFPKNGFIQFEIEFEYNSKNFVQQF